MKKIVVLTSGGDAPGMNAAIRAVVRTGCYYGLEVYGCESGFQGLVDQKLTLMKPESVANCIQHGGTILKTDRCMAFYSAETRQQCQVFLKQQQIDGLIVIGGNGSFRGAALLGQESGIAVIGIPGTIDNDIYGTDYTIGFDTARNTALQAIDKIRDTASSHNRNFLIEVMGRSAGFLAVDVGIAGGAEMILIPELDVTVEAVAKKLQLPKRAKLNSIIIVAESNQPGRSVAIAEKLKEMTHQEFRVCILGHTQRGGSPTTLDRKIASEMGFFAVKALLDGERNKMLAAKAEKILLIDFPSENFAARTFTEQDILKLNDILCI